MGHVNDYVKEIEDIAASAGKRIEQDIQGWRTEAEILDEDKDQRLQSMQQVVDQMMKETSYLLVPAQRPMLNQRQLKLTKLPVFGAKCTDKQIMFEWPKQSDLTFVRKGARIPSLQFLTIHGGAGKGLGAIQIQLSNGMKSDLFKVAEIKDLKQEFIKFGDTKRITQIKAVVYNPMIVKLSFMRDDQSVTSSHSMLPADQGQEKIVELLPS